MRDSVVFYRSFYEAIKELASDDFKSCVEAIMEYGLNDIEPEAPGIAKAIFTMAKPQIDANNRRYSNGTKGGRPSLKPNDNQTEPNCDFAKPNVNVNENVNVNDNEINNALSEDESSSSDTAKASKHKYGEYKHVLLKDEELQALKKDYANWEELIKYLDEYIEMKGYKAKSHYLCIKKWVVDAVKQNNSRAKENKSNRYTEDKNNQYQDLSKFYMNL